MDAFAYLIPYGLEWLNLIVRWLHVITGIAWIGASFYFVWLDNSIRPPAAGSELAKKGVSGELWAVHGGGFYNPQKYLVAPAELPKELHWFKWEAYSTWLSGIALLTIAYYFNAQAMMIDKQVADIGSWQAVGIGIGTLVAGWTVYDLLCRSPLGQRELPFGIVVFVLIVAAAYGLTHVLSGRAAYIHVGALIGTIMVGNVLMLIIPGQRKMVEAMQAGGLPDPRHGQKAKQRSVHNNYFTLPVLFIMISNHYAMTYRNDHAWLVLAFVMAAGVLIRHFFNLRHKGRVEWRYPVAGVALLLGVAVTIAPPAPVAVAPAADPAAAFNSVKAVIGQRCASCHSAHPTQPGFATAPLGMVLDTDQQIHQSAEKIYKQAVQLKAMPIGNLTNMTDAERATIAAWYESGAK
ncbi:urate hydroxylase PuuD [Rugamonas apoptosis]|uniref:Urate hydroxylase PuuD n=1 Tax=Rugamonas apoptosis TaxID=2758570 RepID=A0A7W2FAZ1_9BURK|nr:urate hydroxylase PuuD [Rugamonas apoptosis]MBA5688325.1 urate hydroxylase PuuD [Rugamonas apoptosis]